MRPSVYMTRHHVRDFLLSRSGRMMTIQFIKKDGSRRTLNGRVNVTAYQTGGEKTTNDRYVVVWESPKPHQHGGAPEGRYRNVNTSTVEFIRADGMDINVI